MRAPTNPLEDPEFLWWTFTVIFIFVWMLSIVDLTTKAVGSQDKRSIGGAIVVLLFLPLHIIFWTKVNYFIFQVVIFWEYKITLGPVVNLISGDSQGGPSPAACVFAFIIAFPAFFFILLVTATFGIMYCILKRLALSVDSLLIGHKIIKS